VSALKFSEWVSSHQTRVEHLLDEYLPSNKIAPLSLHEAMRYATLNGGKRIRALLAFAAAEFAGQESRFVDKVAIAVELIHAYSLVHDDMPCMDDDDLRRGKPSCHKKYDESTALLVGDALQSLAFEILTNAQEPAQKKQLEITHQLAIASGSRGMAGGQQIDLESSGKSLNESELEMMHMHKTGALIRASVIMGGLASGIEHSSHLKALTGYANFIGLAFQVTDDILDAEADTQTLGKTAGKDALQQKSTYVTLLGLNRAKQKAKDLYEQAIHEIQQVDANRSKRLVEIADWITQRGF
jgi:farnesyl diphosphate synthase